MKKMCILPVVLVISSASQAMDLGGLREILTGAAGKNTANVAVGVLENSSVDAEAEASNGGMAAAGGVVAKQNTKNKAASTNVSVGILKNTNVTARARANGRNSQALAGGVIAGVE